MNKRNTKGLHYSLKKTILECDFFFHFHYILGFQKFRNLMWEGGMLLNEKHPDSYFYWCGMILRHERGKLFSVKLNLLIIWKHPTSPEIQFPCNILLWIIKDEHPFSFPFPSSQFYCKSPTSHTKKYSLSVTCSKSLKYYLSYISNAIIFLCIKYMSMN